MTKLQDALCIVALFFGMSLLVAATFLAGPWVFEFFRWYEKWVHGFWH